MNINCRVCKRGKDNAESTSIICEKFNTSINKVVVDSAKDMTCCEQVESINADQRKMAYALIREVAQLKDVSQDNIKSLFKERHGIDSLSDCSMLKAMKMIEDLELEKRYAEM